VLLGLRFSCVNVVLEKNSAARKAFFCIFRRLPQANRTTKATKMLVSAFMCWCVLLVAAIAVPVRSDTCSAVGTWKNVTTLSDPDLSLSGLFSLTMSLNSGGHLNINGEVSITFGSTSCADTFSFGGNWVLNGTTSNSNQTAGLLYLVVTSCHFAAGGGLCTAFNSSALCQTLTSSGEESGTPVIITGPGCSELIMPNSSLSSSGSSLTWTRQKGGMTVSTAVLVVIAVLIAIVVLIVAVALWFVCCKTSSKSSSSSSSSSDYNYSRMQQT